MGLRCSDVVRVRVVVGVVARDARHDHAVRNLADAAEGEVDELLLVDSLGESDPEVLVRGRAPAVGRAGFRRALLGVLVLAVREVVVGDGLLREVLDQVLVGRIRLDSANARAGDHDRIEGALLERGEGGFGVATDEVVDLGQCRLDAGAAVPARVRDQLDLGVVIPRLDHERPGRNEVSRFCVLGPALRMRDEDPHRHDRAEVGRGSREVDHDRAVIRSLDACLLQQLVDLRRVGRGRARAAAERGAKQRLGTGEVTRDVRVWVRQPRVQQALRRQDEVAGDDRAAVRVLEAGAQLERQGLAVVGRRGQCLGERRHQVEVLVVVEQRATGRIDHADRHGVLRRLGIHCRWVFG